MNATNNMKHVVVVGGGIAGLSTAWYLLKAAKAAGTQLHVTVLEAQERWGGKVLTETVDHPAGSFTVEAGPDSYLTQKPWAGQLAQEVGIARRIIGTNDASRKVYVVNRGRPTPMPDGVLLIVPTKFMPFALSPLISPLGKLRMGLDFVIPPKRDGRDETLAAFVTRRLGREALDKIAEPLMSGIYNAEADKQSVLATFPRFRAMEEQYGSLTRGILASRRNGHSTKPAEHRGAKYAPGAATQGAGTNGNGSGPKKKPSAFQSFAGGSQELIDATVAALAAMPDQIELRTGTRVVAIDPGDAWTVRLAGGEQIGADAVVMACPAFAAADLVQPHAIEAAEKLAAIRYVSTGTVSLAYHAEDIARARAGGFGLVVPMSEKRPVNAVTFSSIKFDHRAPEGYVLLRVFFGGSRSPKSMDLDDQALLAAVRRELSVLLEIDGEPLFHRIYRWLRSNPQYDVGHLDRVAEIEQALPAGLFVTGSPYKGVGLPDCVKQAEETAAQVIAVLRP
jgi:protoporphyrinogen/coproporphyrinogen III oxidase